MKPRLGLGTPHSLVWTVDIHRQNSPKAFPVLYSSRIFDCPYTSRSADRFILVGNYGGVRGFSYCKPPYGQAARNFVCGLLVR